MSESYFLEDLRYVVFETRHGETSTQQESFNIFDPMSGTQSCLHAKVLQLPSPVVAPPAKYRVNNVRL